MGRYNDLADLLRSNNLSDRFDALSEEELKKEVDENPNVPAEYIDFLREIGFGDVGDGYYMIYSGLIAPESIFDEATAKELEGIMFFGDDFNGYCGGFLTNENWKLVEVGSSCDLYELEMTFEEFIREKISVYINDLEE